jgi:gliding motility-associated-like protein
MRKGGLIILFCLLYIKIFSQDTCQTIPYYPLNILSNPSFENPAQPCTSGFQDIPFWYAPTNEVPTAFLNACTDFLISDSSMSAYSFICPNISFFPTVPQPIPDGNGVAAISDYGYFNGTYYVYPFHKSYVSTCLTSPLEKDSLYRFEFYVGFGGLGSEYLQVHNQLLIPEYSQSPEKFTLFGLSDCSNIDVSIPFLGCLSVAGWTPLGSCTVTCDTGKWVKAAINFSPGQQIQAIALGPACDTIFVPYPDTYLYKGEQVTAQQFSYFLDKFQFFQSSVPKPIVSEVSGGPCSSSVVLQMQPAVYYAGSSLQWYKNDTVLSGQQGSTLTVLRDQPGTASYSCRVQNDSICLASDSFPLVWAPIPNGAILGAPDTTACIGDTVVLNAFTDSSFSYTWQNGVNGPSLSATQSGTYSLTISNQCGTAHAAKTISFGKCDLSLAVPNAFTPNGDGLNDLFKVHYFKMPLQFSMRIFNRNGMELFFTTNPGTGWDGMFDGVSQPAGSYVWYIRYQDEKNIDHVLKGVLVLVR